MAFAIDVLSEIYVHFAFNNYEVAFCKTISNDMFSIIDSLLFKSVEKEQSYNIFIFNFTV